MGEDRAEKASGITDVIAGLSAAGEKVDDGVFTLDRDTAREKMRQFRLGDPSRYILDIVRAAVLRGAAYVAITFDSDDVHIRFNGEPFSLTDFDLLWNAMFARGEEAGVQSLRSLALALNAATGTEARAATVVSPHPDGVVELRLSADGEESFRTLPEGPDSPIPTATQIHLESSHSLARMRGKWAPEAHLREYCRFTPAEVTVNGTRVSGRKAATRHFETTVTRGAIRARVGFIYWTPNKATIHLVRGGVLMATATSSGLAGGIEAIVESPALNFDLSADQVIKDEEYAAVLDVVAVAADQALIEMANADARGFSDGRRILRHHALARLAGDGEAEPNPVREALHRARIWPKLGQGKVEWVSLAELEAFAAADTAVGGVLAKGRGPDGGSADPLSLLPPGQYVQVNSAAMVFLGRRIPGFRDVTDVLAKRVVEARRAAQAKPPRRRKRRSQQWRGEWRSRRSGALGRLLASLPGLARLAGLALVVVIIVCALTC